MHLHRFERQTHALRVIGDWIAFYNQQRPHQALRMMTPDAAYAATLTAWPEQKPMGHYTSSIPNISISTSPICLLGIARLGLDHPLVY